MADLALRAELLEAQAEAARLRAQLAEADQRTKHLGETVNHYLIAWLDYRDRVFALRGALKQAAEVLGAEGLERSAHAALEALEISRRGGMPGTTQDS